MLIDNFDVIEKKLLKFDFIKLEAKSFYVVDVIDNDTKIIIKKFFIHSRSELLNSKNDIIMLCHKINGTAYINLEKINIEDVNLKLMSKIASCVAEHNIDYKSKNPYDLVDDVISSCKNTKYLTLVFGNEHKSHYQSIIKELNNCPNEKRKKIGCKTEVEYPSMNYIKICDDKENIVYDNVIAVVESLGCFYMICYYDANLYKTYEHHLVIKNDNKVILYGI